MISSGIVFRTILHYQICSESWRRFEEQDFDLVSNFITKYINFIGDRNWIVNFLLNLHLTLE